MAEATQDATQPVEGRHSRFGLFAPFVLLALVAVGWSVAWFVIRGRTAEGLDTWLAREAAAGRQWTCADRTISGYPFRIEVTCGALSLRRGDTTASLGRLHTAAQVYRPRHIIAEVAGPLRAADGQGVSVEADWRLLQVSVQGTGDGFQRASLVADDPKVRLTGFGPLEAAGAARQVEAHLRPDPARFQAEGAYDAALSARGLAIPALGEWIGGDPADLSLDATVTHGRGFAGRALAAEAERWREAGGVLGVERLALVQGARRLDAKGSLRLDDLHRPVGQLDLAAAGFENLIGALLGGGRAGGVGALVGALVGQATRPPASPSAGQPSAGPKPTPLPPLRLDNGRLYFGAFAVPGVRLAPLY